MKKLVIVALLSLLAFSVCGCTSASGGTPAEKRLTISQLEDDVIGKMVKDDPVIKKKLDAAPGYGVFNSKSVNLILVEAGNGFGVVVNKKTGKKTYMKMALGGVGLGLGVKDYRQLMIFKTTGAMTNLIEKGWEVGAHADASATASDSGGEANAAGDISSEVEIYQMTENGLALQASITGTKYYKDKDLN